MKESGLEKELHFDWYRHASLVDHFLADGTTIESFRQARYLELGDFVDQPYEGRMERESDTAKIRMRREGSRWLDGKPHRLVVSKEIVHVAGSDSFEVEYQLKNGEKDAIDLWFGIEFNVGLMAGDASDRYYDIAGRVLEDSRLRSMGEESDVSEFRLVDEWQGLETRFHVSRPATLWRCPIETTSLSEAGLERVYQSSIVLPHWRIRLDRSFSVQIRQSVHHLPTGKSTRKVRGAK